jgi:hypothetical protein
MHSLGVSERARSFKGVSAGLLPPLGIIFALFVAFTASQVRADAKKVKAEIEISGMCSALSVW